jgi:hypothetical protein
MIMMESPLQIEQPAPHVFGKGSARFISYYEFEFRFISVIANQEPELNQHEVLQLAENAGSFAFLDSAEEDVYNDLAQKRE